MKYKYFTPIPEAEMVKIVINGLDYNIRKRLINQEFLDLAQVADKVRQIEKLKMEEERIEREKFRKAIRKEKIAFIEMNKEEEHDQNDSIEAFVAELKSGPPYVCASLKPVKGKEKTFASNNKIYSFNITKSEQIFNVLLKGKQIVLPEGKKMPSKKRIKGRNFLNFI